MGVLDIVKPGVLNGEEAMRVYEYAQEHKFAIPAINVVNSNSINAALEAAKEANSPIIIQFSSGGGKFIGGNGIDSLISTIKGTVIGAKHVHELAEAYGVAVILHTDHANKKALPWIDGLIEENAKYKKETGRALFSSHMLDLSVEPLEENLAISCEYFQKLKELGLGIEVEIGITGGEEEGADSTDDTSKMYTSPEELDYAYSELSKVGDNFTIAAMFGNVHGVYKPGNVKLKPQILLDAQNYIQGKHSTGDKPLYYVFHGGSGSDASQITEAINNGVIKMNVDTDTQWAFWNGTKEFIEKNIDYLQTQIGNPDGEELPNKKYYDPRKWISAGQASMKDRIMQAFRELNCIGKN